MYRVIVEGLKSQETAVAVSSRPWAPGVKVRIEEGDAPGDFVVIYDVTPDDGYTSETRSTRPSPTEAGALRAFKRARRATMADVTYARLARVVRRLEI